MVGQSERQLHWPAQVAISHGHCSQCPQVIMEPSLVTDHPHRYKIMTQLGILPELPDCDTETQEEPMAVHKCCQHKCFPNLQPVGKAMPVACNRKCTREPGPASPGDQTLPPLVPGLCVHWSSGMIRVAMQSWDDARLYVEDLTVCSGGQS